MPVELIVRGYLAGSGWSEYSRTGASAASRCRPACASPNAARADLHAIHQGGDAATTRTSPSTQMVELVGAGPRRRRGTWRSRSTRSRRDRAPKARDHRRRHQVRVRRRRRRKRSDPRRRGPHARLVPLLGADEYKPGRASPRYDKQYVRDYLETIDWDKQPPGPELPPRLSPEPAAVPRGVRADHRWPFERYLSDDVIA